MSRPPEPASIRLLCVEDNPDDVELLAIALEQADPQRPITRNRQPGRCCDAGCSAPGQAVMVDLPRPRS